MEGRYLLCHDIGRPLFQGESGLGKVTVHVDYPTVRLQLLGWTTPVGVPGHSGTAYLSELTILRWDLLSWVSWLDHAMTREGPPFLHARTSPIGLLVHCIALVVLGGAETVSASDHGQFGWRQFELFLVVGGSYETVKSHDYHLLPLAWNRLDCPHHWRH